MPKVLLFLMLMVTASAALAGSLRVTGDRLFMPIEINGVHAEALLDSAAEMTLIDASFAKRLGLQLTGSETLKGTGGTDKVMFATHVQIDSAGVKLTDLTVAVLNLEEISRRLVGEPVKIVLGRELFDAGRFFVDIESGRFERISADEAPIGVRLAMIDNQGIKQILISIEDVPGIKADFDLGNGSEVLVGNSYAAAHGLLDKGRIIGSRQGGGIGGPLSRNMVKLRSLILAGVEFKDVIAAIDATEDAPDANVGVPILRHFVMTIDFGDNALWLTHRGNGGLK